MGGVGEENMRAIAIQIVKEKFRSGGGHGLISWINKAPPGGSKKQFPAVPNIHKSRLSGGRAHNLECGYYTRLNTHGRR